jgi:hypothetical protein
MACHFGCDVRASKFPHQEMFNLTPNPRRRGGEFEIPLQIGELLDLGGQRWKRRENTFWQPPLENVFLSSNQATASEALLDGAQLDQWRR